MPAVSFRSEQRTAGMIATLPRARSAIAGSIVFWGYQITIPSAEQDFSASHECYSLFALHPFRHVGSLTPRSSHAYLQYVTSASFAFDATREMICLPFCSAPMGVTP
jgi:hypothetical protein